MRNADFPSLPAPEKISGVHQHDVSRAPTPTKEKEVGACRICVGVESSVKFRHPQTIREMMMMVLLNRAGERGFEKSKDQDLSRVAIEFEIIILIGWVT